jgi:AcrR family transcriptional regulator
MKTRSSKLENSRQTGKHQVDDQRLSILDAAETLFLQNGLEKTKMVDIAALAGITKITLYRYFPNRDAIALDIQARMLQKITSLVTEEDSLIPVKREKKLIQMMIRNFGVLRDSYRYIGMFDQIYLDNTQDADTIKATKDQLITLSLEWGASLENVPEDFHNNRYLMIISTVIWFLEKLAMRGELTWSDRAVPIEEHLRLFEEMILNYIDRFMDGGMG